MQFPYDPSYGDTQSQSSSTTGDQLDREVSPQLPPFGICGRSLSLIYDLIAEQITPTGFRKGRR